MEIELRDSLRMEAIGNIVEKQRDFFLKHPMAQLSYVPAGTEHTVVIQVARRRFVATSPCYEHALSCVLTDALMSYYRP